MTMDVWLNGTDENPFNKFGLTQNPFPMIADARYTNQVLHLQKLGAEPVPDTDYIRQHLKGWTDEFVNLLCSQFQKGKMVKLTVTFPG